MGPQTQTRTDKKRSLAINAAKGHSVDKTFWASKQTESKVWAYFGEKQLNVTPVKLQHTVVISKRHLLRKSLHTARRAAKQHLVFRYGRCYFVIADAASEIGRHAIIILEIYVCLALA